MRDEDPTVALDHGAAYLSPGRAPSLAHGSAPHDLIKFTGNFYILEKLPPPPFPIVGCARRKYP